MPNVQDAKNVQHAARGRPFALDPLFRAVTALPGIGPRGAKLLEKATGGPKVLDLLFHRPSGLIDRRFAPRIADAPDGVVATLTVTVHKHFPNDRRSQPYKIWCTDETGTLTLVFFNPHRDYLEKNLPEGARAVVSGRIEHYNGKPQMVHPDAIGSLEDKAAMETIEPVYALTAGLTGKSVRKAMAFALDSLPDLPEWQDPAFKAKNRWSGFGESLRAAHFADSGETQGEGPLDPRHPARMRLAYDELLAGQLALALVRARSRRQNGRSFAGDGRLRGKLRAALPFALTGAQERALKDIDADMASPLRMLRLVQGDVGSGKTVVAALAMLNAIETGAQAALMAPTEILARQHAHSLAPLLGAAGVDVAVLTGRDKGKARDAILETIATGRAAAVIGTHALFQDDVAFADLGLAVIDEQHRFGVHQRLQLSSKGKGCDVLVMTATPIPRTLTMTAYGDMDVSRIDEKPPGRRPVKTLLIPRERMDGMIDAIERQMHQGARVYWICPLVEESETVDLAAATGRYEILRARFGDRAGLIHGRMKPDEKDDVMRRFADGRIAVLVATTVIEVGVNVPEATIMAIEHAERFGLAQLHQLRGRVGRGIRESWCFLIYSHPLGETPKQRLTVMRDSEDGFLIAEKDLELRGAGDLLGTRQSGDLAFRLAELPAHDELLAAARDDARLIVDKDPDLRTERGQALRALLYLFEKDQSIRYLRSG